MNAIIENVQAHIHVLVVGLANALVELRSRIDLPARSTDITRSNVPERTMNHALADFLGRLHLGAGKNLTGRRKITLTTPSSNRRVRNRCVFCGKAVLLQKRVSQPCRLNHLQPCAYVIRERIAEPPKASYKALNQSCIGQIALIKRSFDPWLSLSDP